MSATSGVANLPPPATVFLDIWPRVPSSRATVGRTCSLEKVWGRMIHSVGDRGRRRWSRLVSSTSCFATPCKMTVCNQLAPNRQNGDAIGRSFPDVLTAAQCSDSEHGPIARPPLAGVTSRTREPHFPSRQDAQPHNPRVCRITRERRQACVFLDSSQTNILQGVAPRGFKQLVNLTSCGRLHAIPIPLHFAHGSMPGSVLRSGIADRHVPKW